MKDAKTVNFFGFYNILGFLLLASAMIRDLFFDIALTPGAIVVIMGCFILAKLDDMHTDIIRKK